MSSSDRERVLFERAMEMSDSGERAAFLDRECWNDAPLRARLDALIAGFEATGALDRSPIPSAVPTESLAGENEFPTVIGPYKLRQRLGEGGFGEVFLAEQQRPVRRQVALKILKPGMDSKGILARFEAERQALALMEHPHIARVFDAGLTDDRRPYFVMELIKGIPITQYCDRERLSPRERLELFIPVCHAVQHAHQKGIIHRDLKPSNVLVALFDGRPVPKVIDFGVAKALNQKLAEDTIVTQVGAIVGTLEYMAPEQAELNNLDIDTRADIYSLGVMLYELLAGSPPFTAKQLRGVAFNEMMRLIREQEPQKPSTKVSSSADLPSLAACRALEPGRLCALIRGDLDWIVMKCLEKERGRRYETANGLAMELHRYLADEPVLAGPPSANYRLGKFLRRNRGKAVGVGLVALSLVGGTVGASIGLLRADKQRQKAEAASSREREQRQLAEQRRERAEAAERLAEQRLEVAEAERRRANEEATIAELVRSFLQNRLLRQADVEFQLLTLQDEPTEEADRNVTVRELLDRSAAALAPEKIDREFPNQPLVQAQILQTVGITYLGLTEYQRAIEFLERAASLFENHRAAGDRDTIIALNNLAVAYEKSGRKSDSISLMERVLRLCRDHLESDDAFTGTVLNNLGAAYHGDHRFSDAIRAYEEAIETVSQDGGSDSRQVFNARYNLGVARVHAGDYGEARRVLAELLQDQERELGPSNPHTLRTKNALGQAHKFLGDLANAVRLLSSTRAAQERVLGSTHSETVTTTANLGDALRLQGRTKQAIEVLESSLEACRKERPSEERLTMQTMANLAVAYSVTGRFDRAVELHRACVAAWSRVHGPEHVATLTSQRMLGVTYFRMKAFDKSIPWFEELVQRVKKQAGSDAELTLECLSDLGVNYLAVERYADAIRVLEEVCDKRSDDPEFGNAHHALIEAYAKSDRKADAVRWAHRKAAFERSASAGNPSKQLWSQFNAGLHLIRLECHEGAEPLLREALALADGAEKTGQSIVPPVQIGIFNSTLGGALLEQKRFAEAEPYLLRGMRAMLESFRDLPRPSWYHLSEVLGRLERVAAGLGRPDEEARWRKAKEQFGAQDPLDEAFTARIRTQLERLGSGTFDDHEFSESLRLVMRERGAARNAGEWLMKRGPIVSVQLARMLDFEGERYAMFGIVCGQTKGLVAVVLDSQGRINQLWLRDDPK